MDCHSTIPPPHGFGPLLSYTIGWTYFMVWSASFYPQIILNWRRKSVQGLSMDFVHFNVLGFLCYSIFNLAFFFSTEVQEEYKRRNNGQQSLVRVNDVFFAVHALILSSFTLVQTWIYKHNHGKTVSLFARVYISSVAIIVLIHAVRAGIGAADWIDVLYDLSTVKLMISFFKYCPQVYINWVSRSTVGWSIHNILLDFTGGVLSLAQLVLDAYVSGDWSGISGDPVKFGLGFLSISFDLVFMIQHYVLYRDRTDFYSSEQMMAYDANEEQSLLPSDRRKYHQHGPGGNIRDQSV